MRLQSFNALKAFEAAARHSSFKRAGEELNVSPGSISRFVKMLEADLGLELFHRLPNGLELTKKGEALSAKLSKTFMDIDDAISQASGEPKEIRMVLPETLGMRMLIGKLTELNEAPGPKTVHYTVEFKGLETFRNGEFDLGVCCYIEPDQRPADLEFQYLRSESLTPLCSPELLTRSRGLKEPDDLAHFQLLHTYSDKADWTKWIAAAGVEGVDPDTGLTFLSMELSVKAAIQGLGVTIGDLKLFQDEIQRGDLVAPFDFVLSDNTGYFIFGRPERLLVQPVREICDWLVREVGD